MLPELSASFEKDMWAKCLMLHNDLIIYISLYIP